MKYAEFYKTSEADIKANFGRELTEDDKNNIWRDYFDDEDNPPEDSKSDILIRQQMQKDKVDPEEVLLKITAYDLGKIILDAVILLGEDNEFDDTEVEAFFEECFYELFETAHSALEQDIDIKIAVENACYDALPSWKLDYKKEGDDENEL